MASVAATAAADGAADGAAAGGAGGPVVRGGAGVTMTMGRATPPLPYTSLSAMAIASSSSSSSSSTSSSTASAPSAAAAAPSGWSPSPSPSPSPPSTASAPAPTPAPAWTWSAAPLVTPPLFSLVEPKLYRCRLFQPQHFAFLATLRLRTIVYLAPEHLPPTHMAFLAAHNIALHNLGVRYYAPAPTWQPLSSSLLKHALEMILASAHQPLLLMCPTGFAHTGVVVGCLRKMQGWAMSSILEEYERASGTKGKVAHELAIELFDTDLVRAPSAADASRWWNEHTAKRQLERQWLREKKTRTMSMSMSMARGSVSAGAGAAVSAGGSSNGSMPVEQMEYYDELFRSLGRWKLVTSNAYFDPKRSIVQEDED